MYSYTVVFMEVSNIQPKTVTEPQVLTNRKHALNPSFGNFVVATMDAIERGGFAAAFVIQDTIGMTTPRTAAGFVRNRDITNEYNYQEAAEVFIREFVSGSAMVLVPLVMLYGIKKYFGKANDVPVNMIQALGKQFEKSVEKHAPSGVNVDSAAMKRLFYADAFGNMLTNAYSSTTDPRVIEEKALEFADRLIRAENIKDEKTIIQKIVRFYNKTIHGEVEKGSAEDILNHIYSEFAEIRKGGTSNASSAFTSAKIAHEGVTVEKNFAKVITDMQNFAEDMLETLSKKINSGKVNDGNIKEFIKRFTNFRSGSRVLVNASMLAGLIGFCSFIPKLYQLSDKNPGLNGLENKNGKETQPSDASAENAQSGKNVSFKGLERMGDAVAGFGKIVSKEDSWLSKVLKQFEFDGFNTSIMTFLAACTFGIVGPRLKNAREENEYREVLYRDVTTIGTVMFAAKALQHMFSEVCTKISGFALNKKNSETKSFLGKVFDYLRPVNGVHVLTSSELFSHYTNIDKYQDGVVGFMKFVDEQGGNIRKMFASNKEAASVLEELYNLSGATVEYKNATNKDIMSAISEARKNVSTKDAFDRLVGFFKDCDANSFLKKAKFMNSSFNFATLVFVVPGILGWIIPRFNEAMTKKLELAKQEGGKSDAQPATPMNLLALMPDSNSKLAETFNQFIGKK